MRVEALLERRSGEASVVLLGVLRTDSGPVNNRLDQACTVHWAVCFHSAVALRRAARVVQRGGLAVNYSAVVLSDDSSHIWHVQRFLNLSGTPLHEPSSEENIGGGISPTEGG